MIETAYGEEASANHQEKMPGRLNVLKDGSCAGPECWWWLCALLNIQDQEPSFASRRGKNPNPRVRKEKMQKATP